MCEGDYVLKYPGGEEMLIDLLAEKPNSIHCKMAKKLSISRDSAKSISYGLLYGASVDKVKKMLEISDEEAERIYNGYWDGVPALKMLREKTEEFWEKTGKSYLISKDGRKLFARSKHSLLNLLFQNLGSICMKYTYIFTCQMLDRKNQLGNIFFDSREEALNKACSMIIYHKQIVAS